MKDVVVLIPSDMEPGRILLQSRQETSGDVSRRLWEIMKILLPKTRLLRNTNKADGEMSKVGYAVKRLLVLCVTEGGLQHALPPSRPASHLLARPPGLVHFAVWGKAQQPGFIVALMRRFPNTLNELFHRSFARWARLCQQESERGVGTLGLLLARWPLDRAWLCE
jgi:hypothetical protein